MPRLVIEKGIEKGRVIDLPRRGTFFFGRDSSANVPLKDTMFSRVHFKIECREDGYYLVDLESMNGTLVNGESVREVRLQYGDLIKAGETLFSFLAEEQTESTLVGQRIGGYRILERVGRGGMGTVYRAEQVDLQRNVALKVIAEENTKDKNFIDLFLHEARAAAKLNHPNIVQVYDVKRHEQLYYFSMEFVSGGSVQDLLNKVKKLPVDRAAAMVLEAARGLEYAHRKEIIHRDIKPDNLMISESGSIKIGDLGLARSPKEKVGPQEENVVIGTPHYIAPEQVLGRPADFRSDIYSLGSTFYRMVAGVTPYQAPSVRDLVNRKVHNDPKPASVVNPEVPERVDAILGKMMTRDPEKRYQTLGEVVADLEEFLRATSAPVPEAGREATSALRTLASNRKLLVGSGAVALVLVAAAVFGIAAIFKGGEPKPGPGPEIDPPKTSHEVIQLMYVNAENFEITKMDATSPESVLEAIMKYDQILSQHPGTDEARKSGERKGKLEKVLAAARAKIEIDRIELQDAERWQKTLQLFQQGTADFSGVEATASEYEQVSKNPEFAETPQIAYALQRAQHIRSWLGSVEQARRDYEAAVQEVPGLVAESRFREAWERVSRCQQKIRDAARNDGFSESRYIGLLYDERSVREVDEIAELAKKDLDQRLVGARALELDRRYAEAIDLMKTVLEHSLNPQAIRAQTEIDRLEKEQISHLLVEAETKRKKLAEDLRKDAEDFDRESALVYAQFVVRFDFESAAGRLRSLSMRTEEFRIRVETRLAELASASQFKSRLIEVLNDPRGETVNLQFRFPETPDSGKITKATDSTLSIALNSGKVEYYFSQFKPWTFHEWVSGAWKLKDQQVTERRNFAFLCLEIGLYEEAAALIDLIKQNPLYQSHAETREFCDRYREMIEKWESTDSKEVEALKRIARTERFLQAKNVAASAKEIDLLNSLFADTKAVREAKANLDKWWAELQKSGGKDLLENRKENKRKSIQKTVQEEKNRIRERKDDIRTRLSALPDEFERYQHLGDFHFASGEIAISTERYLEAKKRGDRLTQSRDFQMPRLAFVYLALYRNGVVARSAELIQKIRNDGSAKFVTKEGKPLEWWERYLQYYAHWAEEIHRKVDLKILRKACLENPEDPEAIWALADALDEAACCDQDEARAYYRYLLKYYRDYSQVKSGEVLFRLAEALYQFHEIEESLSLFERLKEEYPDHPRVKAGAEGGDYWGSVRRRIDECGKLLKWMGFTPGKK